MRPNEFYELMQTYGNDYQDYFVPADSDKTAKTIEVVLYLDSPPSGSENDSLEILSVKLTRMRQGEVSSVSFNSRGD